ncbi:MAG: NAD(P)H-hydrate dehydratase [Peptostreptococcaceae bacterium]|nr:NAD(P)H-hydrate dehydratase [Peptostreptococcaceae bacterium]
MYALTAKAIHEMDEFTIKNGMPGMVLMENASKGVVEKVKEIFPDKKSKILIVVGSGNNGGDGFCVARWLLHIGYSVNILFLGKQEDMTDDAKSEFQILKNIYPEIKIIKYSSAKYSIGDMDLIIDGLLGTGLNRDVKDDHMTLIDLINKHEAVKISIDIPSGLNATTGEIMKIAIVADYTVTFDSIKIGMLLNDGPDCCGEISIVDIGIAKEGYKNIENKTIICDKEFLDYGLKNVLTKRPKKSYKGTYGTVGIIAGSAKMTGASILAARAAYKAGCGLVKVLCPMSSMSVYNMTVPEAILEPYDDSTIEKFKPLVKEFVESCDSICVGPGFREDDFGKEILAVVLASTARAVIDAGALNLISGNLIDFTFRNCKCVLTPHIGEMAKLNKSNTGTIMKDLIGSAEEFANEYMVSLVLKSSTSVIINRRKEGTLDKYINTLGNSGLATGGSGDVLSGIIASLIAQGNTLNNSVLYGVLIHANASEKFNNERNMMATDIIENM